MKKLLLTALMIAALAVPCAGRALAADHPFTALTAFGDSYSDNAYADGHGFIRSSNTWTWCEYLAQMMGDLPHDNWAFGGAMSDQRNCNLGDMNWSGLLWQIDEYLKTPAAKADLSTTLFTILCGSNDVWGGLEDPRQSAQNIYEAMSRLAKAGARHIAYREASTVIMSPGYLAGDYAKYHDPWAKAVNEQNAATREMLTKDFAKEFPEVKVYYLESDTLFGKIKNNEPGFQFKIFDKPWRGTYTMPVAGEYMWYDDWHFMGEVHRLMAVESLDKIKAALK
ncbi:GDSL-type esterase/lipase family protein [Deltaproteobacteria bacterium OttesenSCG-928-M10]|nr:GDSL-type esterase/lipase family protein [Deltaproteobacteria bacterium OttesenSCG-928-M10]